MQYKREQLELILSFYVFFTGTKKTTKMEDENVENSTIVDKNNAALKLQDSRKCDKFRAEKFQRETKRHWDLFYKRNETRFFKDRHWTTREFQELANDKEEGNDKVLLEVGCGVGKNNFIIWTFKFEKIYFSLIKLGCWNNFFGRP